MSEILIKVLDNFDDLYQFKKATTGSAGFDLIAAIKEKLIIKSSCSILIPCGFCLQLPKNFEAQVRPRSGLALKNSVTVLNSPGTIDSDYRGEVKVILINHGLKDFTVKKGMRVAQIIFQKLPDYKISKVSELSKTSRGEGGFGSTGLK